MKRMIAILAAVAAFTLVADEAQDKANEQAVLDAMRVALRQIEKAELERQEDSAIVKTVFGEDENSSFIVKKELTATQKRFLAMGRRLMQMAFYAQMLEGRVLSLEKRLEDIENDRQAHWLRVEAAKKARKDGNADKVLRAVERAKKASKGVK